MCASWNPHAEMVGLRQGAFYGDQIKLPEDGLMVHQERAYTSPIWYTPKG